MIEAHRLAPAGDIPNSGLPLVIWRDALPKTASAIKERFARHGWSNAWTNGIFNYHHFHSIAHEVLGVSGGEARVRFGGPDGETVILRRGDAAAIPAGVGHCLEWASDDFEVVGAYPGGADYDIRRGDPAERAAVEANLSAVPLPATNPVDGGLMPGWG
ncbi:cupin domain-containing protein [Roseomonas xinghualingensis]|uniref:cupin domain-containing protein n=1 Tax=Roseomonas xinghualingensis TaxID=2986475 RepID=UPI0021F0FA62|nr:cupin domain-containing protein [Roseomonas sp. SXEYE001]MCV4208839.1 cupin domain-containing protein [Roseomonas sp. SXEYE001]